VKSVPQTEHRFHAGLPAKLLWKQLVCTSTLDAMARASSSVGIDLFLWSIFMKFRDTMRSGGWPGSICAGFSRVRLRIAFRKFLHFFRKVVEIPRHNKGVPSQRNPSADAPGKGWSVYFRLEASTPACTTIPHVLFKANEKIKKFVTNSILSALMI